MMMGMEDVQRFNQQGIETAMQTWGAWSKNWQSMAAELGDYTKRSFEDSTATFEKLAGSRSMEQAMAIQTDFAKRAYEDYVAQMTRLTSMYTDLAKNAYKPMDNMLGGKH